MFVVSSKSTASLMTAFMRSSLRHMFRVFRAILVTVSIIEIKLQIFA